MSQQVAPIGPYRLAAKPVAIISISPKKVFVVGSES